MVIEAGHVVVELKRNFISSLAYFLMFLLNQWGFFTIFSHS